jgi:erythromycin esterase
MPARKVGLIVAVILTTTCVPLAVYLLRSPTSHAVHTAHWSVLVDAEKAGQVESWIRSDAIRLAGVRPQLADDDLLPLKRVLKDVRIAGLGEATHGTHEIFQLKHRLFEFLVREMGFRVFVLEASYPACRRINEYVLSGKGDRGEALASQGFWTYDTPEVAEVIDWMRAYNAAAADKDKVKFYGMDIQVLDSAVQTAEDYIRKVDVSYLERAQQAFQPLEPERKGYWDRSYLLKQSNEKKTQVRAGLYEVTRFLEFHRPAFIAETSAAEFDDALRCVRVMEQFYDAYSGNNEYALRDVYMAENLRYILSLEPAGTKAVVWAHNDHVAVKPERLGRELRRELGDKYYALAITFNGGSFQAVDEDSLQLREFRLPSTPPGSLEWYLSQAGSGDLFVNFRSAPHYGPVFEWLSHPTAMRSVSSRFYEGDEGLATVIPGRYFDGVAILRTGTRAISNHVGHF